MKCVRCGVLDAECRCRYGDFSVDVHVDIEASVGVDVGKNVDVDVGVDVDSDAMRARCPSHGSRSMLKRQSLLEKTRDRLSEKHVLIMEEHWQKLSTICTGYECSRDQVPERTTEKTEAGKHLRGATFPKPLPTPPHESLRHGTGTLETTSCSTFLSIKKHCPHRYHSMDTCRTSKANWHVSAGLHCSSS